MELEVAKDEFQDATNILSELRKLVDKLNIRSAPDLIYEFIPRVIIPEEAESAIDAIHRILHSSTNTDEVVNALSKSIAEQVFGVDASSKSLPFFQFVARYYSLTQ